MNEPRHRDDTVSRYESLLAAMEEILRQPVSDHARLGQIRALVEEERGED